MNKFKVRTLHYRQVEYNTSGKYAILEETVTKRNKVTLTESKKELLEDIARDGPKRPKKNELMP